ncbi:MAG: MraY family glycosyltransferase [Patescibacteria group bacterium]
MIYAGLFAVSFFVTVGATALVRKCALHFDITDKPTEARKIHTRPIPLLGGIAVFATLAIVVVVALFIPTSSHYLIDTHVTLKHIIGLLLGGLVLVVGGFLDDVYNLKPYHQIFFPILAALVVIGSGIGVVTLTNPLGGTIDLTQIRYHLFTINGVPYYFTVWSDLLTFFWLLSTIYTTKFLDGLDGLVAGMAVIGCSVLLFISLFLFINIPTASLASIIGGAFAGFLIWNFNPAKIFLGEAGSTLTGYLLGILAIISGAKFATALLILGIPLLDAAHVIFQRLIIERRSPFRGDRKHIHFQLLDSGLTQRQAVGILYLLAIFFGYSALLLQSRQKVTMLLALLLFMVILVVTVLRIKHIRQKKEHG